MNSHRGRLRAAEVDEQPLPLEDAAEQVPAELQPITEEVPSATSDSEEADDENMQGDQETDRMRLEKRLLDDVPLAMRARPQASADSRGSQEPHEGEPSAMPFPKKQKLFEKLAKDLKPPSRMQEARVRNQLENAYEQLRTLRRTLKTTKPRAKATAQDVVRRRSAMVSQSTDQPSEEEPAPEAAPLYMSSPEVIEEKVELLDESLGAWNRTKLYASPLPEEEEETSTTELEPWPSGPVLSSDAGALQNENLVLYLNRKLTDDEEMIELEDVIKNIEGGRATYGCHVTEVLQQHVLWSNPSPASGNEMPYNFNQELQKEESLLDKSKLVTGKQRVEMAWNSLDEEWRKAFVKPIVKGFNVYFQHQALAGVPEGQWVDPRRVLPSRLVLTSKGGNTLEKAELKARWVFGGHRDPDAGKYPTSSPTVSLVGHNLLNFIAVQKGWTVYYEDVSAAFLQGQQLPSEREIYVRIPQGYPVEAMEELKKLIGPGMRGDIVRLLKGGFGLPESPRLWYLEYRQTLLTLGGRELRLLPGFFVFEDDEGNLIGMACIHVDDTRYAGSPKADKIWEALHERLNFGKKRSACEGWAKFCGRFRTTMS